VSRPTLLTVPRFAISLVLGEFGRSSVLAGQRALPKVLQSAGFTFTDTTLDDALRVALAGD
jgi:NAD dependent epimerase/dehydratase family enzyme